MTTKAEDSCLLQLCSQSSKWKAYSMWITRGSHSVNIVRSASYIGSLLALPMSQVSTPFLLNLCALRRFAERSSSFRLLPIIPLTCECRPMSPPQVKQAG